MADGIGGFVSGLFGSENKEKAQGYNPDANAYEYGGRPGGADADAQRYAQRSEDWKNKANEYGAQQQNLYNQGQVSMQQQQQGRGLQMDAASMARARATGQAPSIAQMQGDRAMQQAQAAQAAQAASARGPGALALAQQNAAANTANAQANIAGQTSIAAAQERLAAEQAYAQQAAGIRGGDQNAAQVSYGAGAQAGQLGLGAGNLGLGYTGAEQGVRQAQMTGAMNREAQRSSNELAKQGINANVGGQNAAMNQKNAEGAVGALGDLVEGVMKVSDANAKQPIGNPAEYVPSTWGGVATQAQDEAKQQAAVKAMRAREAYDQAQAQKNPYQRDLDAINDQRRISALLGQDARLTEDDLRKERVARAMLKQKPTEESKEAASKKADAKEEKAKVADGKAVPESKLSKVLGKVGDRFSKSAATVDTAYHGGGGGYVPPHLLAVSDAKSKIPVVDLTKATATQFASNPGTYAMEQGADGKVGIDVMGTFEAQNAKMDHERRNPGGAAAATGPGPMMVSDVTGKAPFALSDMTGKSPMTLSDVLGKTGLSDERAKEPTSKGLGFLSEGGKDQKWAPDGSGSASFNVFDDNFNRERDGMVLRPEIGEDGRGRVTTALATESDPVSAKWKMAAMREQARAQAKQGAGTGGQDGGSESKKAAAGKAAKKGAKASQDPFAGLAAQWAAQMQMGPSTRGARERADAGFQKPAEDQMANAARSMEASAYAYKPELTPPEQRPGEPNVGPMAQNMAADPVAGTAIKKDPETGLLAIDQSKMLKVLGGVAASQQRQLDELKRRKGG